MYTRHCFGAQGNMVVYQASVAQPLLHATHQIGQQVLVAGYTQPSGKYKGVGISTRHLQCAPPPCLLHRVRKQLVNVPSYIVRLDSQKHIDFSMKSPFGGSSIIGRTKRRKSKRAEEGGEEEEDD